MQEKVIAAIARRDEAESFLCVEKFNSTLGHGALLIYKIEADFDFINLKGTG